MMSGFPSIFNDVIGPVMRGPSSSHCAAALRIGRICRDLMDEKIDQVRVFIDPEGSLATTHESQGSDMGLMGGLLGWDAIDDRLPEVANHLAKSGLKMTITIKDIGALHPNTYQLLLDGPSGTCQVTAISTGGGMIEITEIDGWNLSLAGDYHETLIYCDHPDTVLRVIKEKLPYDDILVHTVDDTIIQVRSFEQPDQTSFRICEK